MIRKLFLGDSRRWVLMGLGFAVATGIAASSVAQDGFRPVPRDRDFRDPRDVRDTRPVDYPDYNNIQNAPSLSEATAVLEAAVRTMYKDIEPTQDTESSPNELLAYADLRALRLYVGALEVAGWSLEHANTEYQRFQSSGAYRGGHRNIGDPLALAAFERYRAHRETARTLLYRVRTTSVSVEHQVGYCDPAIAREWRNTVLPALRDTIAACEPVFQEQFAYQGYGIPGKPISRIVAVSGGGVPREAVEVARVPTYQPYDGQGRGQGRYFEIRSYGGPVRVRAIRFKNQESAFGVLGTSGVRELLVNQVAEPGRPLFVAGNRRRWINVSDLQVDWEPASRDQRAYATIELVESSPDDPAR